MDELICVLLGVLMVGGLLVAIVVHWIILLVRARRDQSYEQLIRDRDVYTNVPVIGLDESAITRSQIQKLYFQGFIDRSTFDLVNAALTQAATPRAPAAVRKARTESPPALVAPSPVPAIAVEDHSPRPVATSLPTVPPQPFVPLPPPPPPTPAAPRKSWTQLLEAFMEQSNIRWGELIGGLLIVGCSIALVFTFWDWIADRPWFQFFLFTAITSALFGVGLYTEHRWKLPTTSRGVLLIATLLVPLNFLAIAAFSRDVGSMATLRIAGELLALGLFSWLVWLAGRVLLRPWAGLLAIGVLGASTTQVIIHRLASPQISSATALWLLALPLAFYCGTMAAALAQARRWGEVTSERVYSLFTLLGAVTFAILPPLGLLGFKVANWTWLIRQTSPLLVLAGLPALCTGALLWRRITDSKLASERTAGTSIAAIGTMIVTAALAMAWWHQQAIWIYAAYGAATFIAARTACMPLLTHAASALIGAALVQAFVFQHPAASTPIECWTIVLLIHATLMVAGAHLTRLTDNATRSIFQRPLIQAALCASLLAAPLLLASASVPQIRSNAMPMLAARSLWLAGIWAILAVFNTWPHLFSAFQAMLTVSLGFAVISVLQGQPWFAASPHPLMDPWSIQSLGIAFALLSLIWTGVRLAIRRLAERPWHDLLTPPWPAVDQWVSVAVLIAAVGLTAFAIFPGVGAELSALDNPYTTSSHIATRCTHATGVGGWMLLAAVAAVIIASQWHQFSPWALHGLLLLMGCSCPLLAAQWTDQTAAASAWRWSAGILLLVMSVPLWWRSATAALFARLRWPAEPDQPGFWNDLRNLLLLLTVIPILSLTLYPSILMLAGTHIVGPAPGSFFARIGNAASYLVPLLLLMSALIGHALRQRSNVFALSAGLVLNLIVTLGYLLSLVTSGIAIESTHLVRLAQFNAIASSAFAFAWIAVRRWLWQRQDKDQLFIVPPGLMAQIAIAVTALLITLIPAELAIHANAVTIAHAEAAGPWGWLACILTGSALLWLTRKPLRHIPIGAIGTALLVLGTLLSLTLSRFNADPAFAQHALLAARALAGWLVLAIGWIMTTAAPTSSEARPPAITRWSALFGGLTLILSFADIHSTNLPWTLAGLVATSTLSIALSLWTLRREWLYPAGLLLNIAATTWWIVQGHIGSPSPLLEMVQINLLVLAGSGICSLLLDLNVFRPTRDEVVRPGLPAFHHIAAIVGTIVLAAISVLLLLGGFVMSSSPSLWLTISAAGAVCALMLACLWDIDARYPLPGLYILGLTIAATAMALLDWNVSQVIWRGTIILAGYTVLLGYLFTLRINLARTAEHLAIPLRRTWPASRPGWVGMAVMIQSVIVQLLAAQNVLTWDDLPLRLAIATSAIAVAVAIGLMAKDLQLGLFHRASLLAGATGVILWGWAWLGQDTHGWLLDRAVVLMIATAAMTAFYAVGMVKLLRRTNAWTQASQGLVPIVGGVMIAALILIFGAQVTLADAHGTGMSGWAVAAVTATLFALISACIICAVVPGRDPLELSERGRTAYVYAAESILALLFLHVRLNFPWIFTRGLWMRFWPFIIMAIAFAGVGLSEFFRRQKRIVLAEPLERTGAFLPLLPVLAYWATTAQPAWQAQFSYAGALLLAGLVYTTLAILRKSYGCGLVAALMANGSLWAVLYRIEGLAFTQHPQLWLIPFAVCALVAAHLNRDRLTTQQLQAIRYLALLTIYVSSTSEIFIHSLYQAPWLPLVLAMLAVAGVMSGILLRIQSFLIVGTVFLVVAIASMIQYAAHQVDSYWPWAVAGIVLGMAMVAVFAVAEKKREQMLQLVDGLKEWQG